MKMYLVTIRAIFGTFQCVENDLQVLVAKAGGGSASSSEGEKIFELDV